MNKRIKRLAAEAVFEIYRTSKMQGKYMGARKDDLVDAYLMGYYQGAADTAVEMVKREQPLLQRIKAKIKALFVLPAEPEAKHFENDWRYH